MPTDLTGEQLARTVAEKVMGWCVGAGKWWVRADTREVMHAISHWRPDRDIEAAMEVLEHLGKPALLGWNWAKGHQTLPPHSCTVAAGDEQVTKYADTLPLAICRAALAAVKEPNDD